MEDPESHARLFTLLYPHPPMTHYTTMTTGRESAEGVSPKGHFEETVGVDLG